MRDGHRFYVAEERHHAGRLHSASTMGECLAWIRGRPTGGTRRLVVWADSPGADVAVCLPLDLIEDRRATAAAVVDAWEGRWLLIESAPRSHRADAREELVDRVTEALVAAAVVGVDGGLDPDLPF